MEDEIRLATYRKIYGNSALSPYSLRTVPPIHIIVGHRNVTLDGVVANQMVNQIAENASEDRAWCVFGYK